MFKLVKLQFLASLILTLVIGSGWAEDVIIPIPAHNDPDSPMALYEPSLMLYGDQLLYQALRLTVA